MIPRRYLPLGAVLLVCSLLLGPPAARAVTLDLSEKQRQPFLMTWTGDAYLVADWDTGLLHRYPRSGEPRRIPSPLNRFWQPAVLRYSGGEVWSLDRRHGTLVRFHPDGNLISLPGSDTPGRFAGLSDLLVLGGNRVVLAYPDRIELIAENGERLDSTRVSGDYRGFRLAETGGRILLVSVPGGAVAPVTVSEDSVSSGAFHRPGVPGRVIDAAALPGDAALVTLSTGENEAGSSLSVIKIGEEDMLISDTLAVPLITPRRVVRVKERLVGVLASGEGKIYEFRLPDEIF